MEQPSYGLRIFSQAFLMEWTGLFIVMNDMGNSGCLAISALCHALNALIRTCRIRNIPNRLPFVLLASTQVDDYR